MDRNPLPGPVKASWLEGIDDGTTLGGMVGVEVDDGVGPVVVVEAVVEVVVVEEDEVVEVAATSGVTEQQNPEEGEAYARRLPPVPPLVS